MTTAYNIVAFSRDVELPIIPDVKHSGYGLVKYENGVPVAMKTVEVTASSVFGTMGFVSSIDTSSGYNDGWIPVTEINGNIVPLKVYENGAWLDTTNDWVTSREYKTVVLTDSDGNGLDNAEGIYRQIQNNADLLNKYGISYDPAHQNCNTWVSYIDSTILGEIGVFDQLNYDENTADLYLGANYPFPWLGCEMYLTFAGISAYIDYYKDAKILEQVEEIQNLLNNYPEILFREIHSSIYMTCYGIYCTIICDEFTNSYSTSIPLHFNYPKETIDNFLTSAESHPSPLVLDLDGDGVETVGVDQGTYFDHDGNGFAENTGWVGVDDGLLVRDLNENGVIDDGTELFGNNSVLSSGATAENGFEALADLDSNEDGTFNSSDTAWNSVKVWKDADQDGITDEGELITLENAGVTGINLNYTSQNTTDVNNNEHKQTGTFTTTDNTTSTITDVWFDAELSDTKDKTDVELSEAISALPDVEGWGNVHNLRVAMALDTTGALQALIEQYVAETNAVARYAMLDNIIFHWTGVQNINPLSRKPSYFYDNPIQDARYLEALEEFWGETYSNQWWFGKEEENPHEQAAAILLKGFDTLREYVGNSLEQQTHCKSLLEGIQMTWNETTSEWIVNVTTAYNALTEMFSANSISALRMLYNLESIIKQQNIMTEEICSAFQTLGATNTSEYQIYFVNFGELENKISSGSDIVEGLANDDFINALAGNDKIYGNDGNDTLIGGLGNDYLVGGNGSDVYFYEGTWGNDTIDNSSDDEKGAHPDKILFGEGIAPTDVTVKRTGNDLILSLHNGADTIKVYSYFLEAGTTNNTIDTIEFADGTTWNYEYVRVAWNAAPESSGGFLTLSGTNGNDSLSGQNNSTDFISGEKGNDIIRGNSGNDIIYGGQGNDTLYGDAGDDVYIWNLGDGFDTIDDSANNDTISFGKGITYEDLRFSGSGNDLRILVKNNPTQGLLLKNFFSSLSYKIEDLIFTDGTTVHLSEIPLTLDQDDTNDTVYGTEYGDTIYGNGGNDTIYGGKGTDIINGGAGDDRLYGDTSSSSSSGTGNDIITGGLGNDYLSDDYGNETYIYNLGDGLDTISDDSGADKIVFGEGISFNDFSYRAEGNNLRIIIGGNETQGIIINDFFSSSSYKIETLEFADGSTVDFDGIGFTLNQTSKTSNLTTTIYDDIVNLLDTPNNDVNTSDGNDVINGGKYEDTIYGGKGTDIINGGSGDDRLYGDTSSSSSSGAGNDIITGGLGNDYLSGNYGNDTYVYNLGDGLDTIHDSNGTDKIVFGEGILFNDFSYRAEGNNLRIIIGGDESQGIIINDFFSSSSYKIETLEFADGSTVDFDGIGFTLNQTSRTNNLTTTIYDDVVNLLDTPNNYVNTSDGNDVINGGKYEDTIYGGKGTDIINGGSGDDSLYGDTSSSSSSGAGNDIITGGLGNDYLSGNYGNDTYVYNLGDGLDTIHDTNGTDKIVFGEGISFNDFSYRAEGDDLRIIIGGDESQGIIINNFFYSSSYKIETLEFADGSTVDFDGIGFSLNQTSALNGTTLTAYDDTINLFVDDLNNVNGGAGNDTINGGKYNDTIYGGNGADIITGGSGDDSLYGDTSSSSSSGTGNDIITGGLGNDYLSGNYGNDTYVYNLGDGLDTIHDINGTDKIVFGEGISFNDFSYRAEDSNLRIIIGNNETQGIIINNFFYSSSYKIETLEFADGSTIDFDGIGFTLNQIGKANSLTTTAYDDVVNLLDTPNNSVHGGSGNDTISGGLYKDTIYGDAGADVITGGAGDDTIYGDDSSNSNSGAGNDIITGGLGNDYLSGNYGSDTYVYNLGDGLDTIYDTNGADKIIFGEGISFNDFSYRIEGDNLRIIIGGDETQGIIINDFFYSSSYKIETLEFADGSTVNFDGIGFTLNQTSALSGTTLTAYDDTINLFVDDDNSIHGGSGNDTINGGVYKDTLYGDAGTDVITGGAGDDTIYGDDSSNNSSGAGNDILTGGLGNDYLSGNYGNDTYVYNLGDGLDTIHDTNGTDKIVFGENIGLSDLTFSQDGNDLHININNDTNQGLIIDDYFYSSSYKCETIEFNNGSSFNLSDSSQLVQAINSFGSVSGSSLDLSTSPVQNVSEMYDIAYNSTQNKQAI